MLIRLHYKNAQQTIHTEEKMKKKTSIYWSELQTNWRGRRGESMMIVQCVRYRAFGNRMYMWQFVDSRESFVCAPSNMCKIICIHLATQIDVAHCFRRFYLYGSEWTHFDPYHIFVYYTYRAMLLFVCVAHAILDPMLCMCVSKRIWMPCLFVFLSVCLCVCIYQLMAYTRTSISTTGDDTKQPSPVSTPPPPPPSKLLHSIISPNECAVEVILRAFLSEQKGCLCVQWRETKYKKGRSLCLSVCLHQLPSVLPWFHSLSHMAIVEHISNKCNCFALVFN